MGNLAIIPARGGSKRIPGKNIKSFLGKPILAYSIETALNSGLFEEVMVSTDDEKISAVAKAYGANLPFMRSAKNADDFATTMDVLSEVVHQYISQLHRRFEFVCCIYPTSPLTTITDLKNGYQEITKKDADVVFPIDPYSYPVLRGLVLNAEGSSRMKWPEYLRTRSQDLEKVYHDSGQWYWYNGQSLLDNKIDIIRNIVSSELNVQDIDNEDDWLLAEMKYAILQNKQQIK